MENVFKEIIAENFPELAKDINLPIQEVELLPNKVNPKNPLQDI